MLYILDCMLYGLKCALGVHNQSLKTTGQAVTFNDLGVCLLGWYIVLLLVLFVRYCIAYAVRKHKIKTGTQSVWRDKDSNEIVESFLGGILYLAECVILWILCAYKGRKATLYTTGKNPTEKEIVYCVFSWVAIGVLILCIVLLCI